MLANTCLKVEPSGDDDASLPARPALFTHNGRGASAPVPLPRYGGPEHLRPHPSGLNDDGGGASAPVPLPRYGGPEHQRPHPSGDDGDGAGYQNRFCLLCLQRDIDFNNNNNGGRM
eukprot:810814-Rhodomonas_salina.1